MNISNRSLALAGAIAVAAIASGCQKGTASADPGAIATAIKADEKTWSDQFQVKPRDLLRKLPKTGRFTTSGLMLGEATDRERGYLSQPARDELVGSLGVALTDLRPAGTGRFGNERVDVVSDASWISAGTPIRIIRAEGYRHVVEPVEAGADTGGTGSAESSMGGSEAATPPRDAQAEARPEPTE